MCVRAHTQAHTHTQVAARFDDKSVDLHHFEKAIDRVIGGLEKKNKVRQAAKS
jgi:ATP-dependent Zn protease